METAFAVGDTVRVVNVRMLKDKSLFGKEGEIISAGGKGQGGFRKLGSGEFNGRERLWEVDLDDVDEPKTLPESSLEKIP